MSAPTFTPDSADAIAKRLANAPKGIEVFSAVRKAMGLPPITEEDLKEPLPPWTEEEAAVFAKIIEDMRRQS